MPRQECEQTTALAMCGLIGNPVAHSLSPAMHNAAFRHCRLPFVYAAWRVEKTALAAALSGIVALGIRGVNVTLPYKQAVVPLLPEVDSQARAIGAVNTIVNDNGILRGYNTDVAGFVSGLAELPLHGCPVALLGAGGAACAASFALLAQGARLTILNRTLPGAQALAARMRGMSSQTIESLPLTAETVAACVGRSALLVNATSVGMWPHADESPVPYRCLRRGLVVYDLVYRPQATRLLREAAASGATIIDGVEMLVGQGALAFTLWTGTTAPRAVMRAAVEKELGRL